MSAVESTAISMSAVSATPSRSLKGRGPSGFGAGDDSRAAFIGDIGPGPIEEDGEAITEPDQKPDVGKCPRQPGKVPAQVNPAEIGDRRLPADRREITVVAIGKGGKGSPARHVGEDRFAGIAAHLLGGG